MGSTVRDIRRDYPGRLLLHVWSSAVSLAAVLSCQQPGRVCGLATQPCLIMGKGASSSVGDQFAALSPRSHDGAGWLSR
jgi:hypothetical protein